MVVGERSVRPACQASPSADTRVSAVRSPVARVRARSRRASTSAAPRPPWSFRGAPSRWCARRSPARVQARYRHRSRRSGWCRTWAVCKKAIRMPVGSGASNSEVGGACGAPARARIVDGAVLCSVGEAAPVDGIPPPELVAVAGASGGDEADGNRNWVWWAAGGHRPWRVWLISRGMRRGRAPRWSAGRRHLQAALEIDQPHPGAPFVRDDAAFDRPPRPVLPSLRPRSQSAAESCQKASTSRSTMSCMCCRASGMRARPKR